MQSEIEISNLPKPSSKQDCELNYNKFFEKNPDYKNIFSDALIKKTTDAIFGNSPYLSDIIIKNPEFYSKLFEAGFEECFSWSLQLIDKTPVNSQDELMKLLREEKLKTSLLIALAEISKAWKVQKTTEKLSIFADLCINRACEFLLLEYHHKNVIKLKNLDYPLKDSGLVVIALGKLGSYELNYSSDIDISIFYEEDKLEYKGRIALAQLYIDLAKDLTKILSERTPQGYVFRVDMRLRPDPGANPLAIGLKKAEKYYFTVGQNWERAAMIKSRFVCGDKKSGEIFTDFMAKNVWRKSLDFETIEDIHSIKRQIDTKQGLHPDNLFGYNVKLGKGGIREVEFYAQTQQLIWGGRKPYLRQKRTQDALFALAKEGDISVKTAQDMQDAYLFYRMVEHRLQMINDEQTHSLPKDDEQMEKLAIFCGFENEKELLKILYEKINLVRSYYTKLFETSDSLASNLPQASGSLIFTGAENHPDTLETLQKMGFKNPDKVSDIVRGWHHGRYNCTIKKRARAELTKLMPLLFSAFAKSPDADSAFSHFDEFLSKLPESSQIFSLLYVNPALLDLLAEVMGGYPEIAENISKNPALIEYVIMPEFYDEFPDIETLEKSLDSQIDAFSSNFDDALEIIKNWCNDRKFRLGIKLVKEEITSDKLSLALSDIAEVVLKKTLKLIVADFEKEEGKVEGANFAIIAFGKFGSRELTFNTDLDLVFVYDFKKESSKFSTSNYFLKIYAKLISALSNVSVNGKLYDVDTRLRPLGESGQLACRIKSFDEYYNPQKREGTAWVFEYIALTRARVIALDDKFQKKLIKLIKEKLHHEWDEKSLHKESIYIYKKFRDSKKPQNDFDIKNSIGGLFDLEFMIRYLQLKHMHKNPEIYGVVTIKTINNLYKISALNKKEYETIKNAFYFYRELQNLFRITSETQISAYVENIIMKKFDIKNSKEIYQMLESIKQAVKKIFEKHL
jgi:glutamate-ammonia-ligase adenylyltransferase